MATRMASRRQQIKYHTKMRNLRNMTSRYGLRHFGTMVFSTWMAWLLAADFAAADVYWTESVDAAFQQSQQLGRPILALGVGPHCGPCQELKRRLREEPSIAESLNQFVVLEMDSQTGTFRTFVQAHPDGYGGTVPMVYLFGPDQQLQYAQPGLMPTQRLTGMLSRALELSGPPLEREQLATVTRVLYDVRSDAREGRITTALQKVRPVSSRAGSARVLHVARAYEQQLVSECQRWTSELDQALMTNDRIHASAYRLAQMYVQLREFPDVQSQCGELLTKYQRLPSTSNAILQAKHLVRARVAEQRTLCDEAMNSYQRIIAIDHASPIAKYASNRLPQIENLRSQKVAR